MDFIGDHPTVMPFKNIKLLSVVPTWQLYELDIVLTKHVTTECQGRVVSITTALYSGATMFNSLPGGQLF